MKETTYTYETLKPHLVNILFEHIKFTHAQRYLERLLGDTENGFPSWLYVPVWGIAGIDAHALDGDEEIWWGLDDICNIYNEGFMGNEDFVRSLHDLNYAEHGAKLKTELEKYVDLLFGIGGNPLALRNG